MGEKRQLFLTVEYQLINIGGIREQKVIIRQININTCGKQE